MLVALKRPLTTQLAADIRKGRTLRSRGPVSDRSSSAVAALPEGWNEATAPDGKTYYFNAEGKTRWDRPAPPAGQASPRGGTTALAVKSKPVMPNLDTLGKLPRGWRMVTGEDGKQYYYNKNTGECSWTPPPPEQAAEDGKRDFADLKEVVKDGWRRTKQQAAVRVFKLEKSTDVELEAQHERLLQIDAQMRAIKASAEAHFAALVEVRWSGEQLSQKLSDYNSEPGSTSAEPARQGARVWHELQRGATRALEQQMTGKCLQPLEEYLGE